MVKFKLVIIVFVATLFIESCSSSFFKDENRENENKIIIENNLQENLEIRSIKTNILGSEENKLIPTYPTGQNKQQIISLKKSPKKITLICYSPNSDTGTIEIVKKPRRQAVVLNILATPFFLGLNWIPEILNPSFYRISKNQSKIYLSNLKYNEKYIETQFNDRFKKYNYDSLVDLVSKFHYSHKIELFKRAIDSIEYQIIKNSIDTNQFKYFEQRTLSLFYKKKVEYNIKQIREIFNFQNSNQNSKSQIVLDFNNSYKDNNFKYLLENLYITNKNRELLKNYEHREAIELLKFTNEIAINRQSNTSLGTEYKLIQKKYNQSILKDLKSQLKNKKGFYVNYVLLDSIIFKYKNQNFLFTSVLDSIEDYLFENRFAYIQNELSICQTQECQQKIFSSFKENLNYPILAKNLGTYIYENLQFITNRNDFTLFHEANEDCSFIVESEYSKISKFQYKSVNAKKHRSVFVLDESNSKHPLKEINIYNEIGKLCIKIKPTDSKFFASKNQYFKDGKIVGVQYIYKKHDVNTLLNTANFVYDEKGNVENTKPIISSINNFFTKIKSLDSLGTTQLSELSNQFRKTKLDLDTFLEIPEFSSIFTLLNAYEMKISNAFKKAEIREKVFQEKIIAVNQKNLKQFSVTLENEKNIIHAIVQKKLDHYVRNEYNQITGTVYKFALIDPKTNKLISDFIYDEITYIENLNRFYLSINGKSGMANASGEIVIPTIFYKINYEDFSSKGFARCCLNSYNWDNIIDFSGKIILKNNAKIVITEWTSINSFIVQIDDKFGVYNTNYKPIVECIYDELIDIEYNSKISGYKYLGRKKTAYSNTIDILTENNNITKSINIVNEGKLEGNSSLYWREDYFVFILNSMIPIFLPMNKMNYYLINSDQYLFDNNQGLFVKEYLDINKTNFQNSKVYILSTTVESHPEYTKLYDIKLYKNQKVLDLQNLISSCNCKNNNRFQTFNISFDKNKKTIKIDCVKSFEYRECGICVGRKMDYYPIDGSYEFKLSEF